MAAAYVAGSLIGDGQTVTTSAPTVTIPAGASIGNVAIVAFEINVSTGTFATPSGWTLLTGPVRLTSPSNTVYLFGKVLASGEPGSTVAFTYSETRRIVGTVSVFSGVTLTGALTASVGESASTSTTLPSLASVSAGSMVAGLYGREHSTASSPQFTSTPTGYTAGGQSRSTYVDATNHIGRAVYQVASSGGTYGGETASTDLATSGVNLLLALPPTSSGGAADVYGVTALVTVSAPTGSGGVPVAASVTGVTAVVVAEGGAKTAAVLPTPGAWPPDPYRQAIRSAVAIWHTVDAEVAGVTVPGATGMAPTGGTVTDTIKAGVRRVANLELPPTPGLYDLLAPEGTQLRVTAHVRYTSRDVLDLPMGVFVIDSEKLSEGGGGISVTAPDKWSRIQKARFLQPQASTVGTSVVDQITRLIRGALGSGEVVNNYATSTATVGTLVWEKDRDKAIMDLAKSASVWVYFDRDGVATIADLPTAGASADWLADASASGVLTSLDRERSRDNTYNVVVVESSATDGPYWPTQFVWDYDPTSPTYAGVDPVSSPDTAGPFGIVPYFYSTPLPLDQNAARRAGWTILARVSGLASQVSLGQVPNPAVDSGDVIDVLPPRERYDQPRVLERHVVDTVTHPLTVDGEQHIDARSTRIEELDG